MWPSDPQGLYEEWNCVIYWVSPALDKGPSSLGPDRLSSPATARNNKVRHPPHPDTDMADLLGCAICYFRSKSIGSGGLANSVYQVPTRFL